MNYHLAIILPCYNPPTGWENIVLKSYYAIRQSINKEVQIIIANDGSEIDIDDCINFLQQQIPDLIYINQPLNKGKGATLRNGIRNATANYYIYTDIDFPYSHLSLLQVYNKLLEGNDVVAGIKDKKYYEHTPIIRRRISKVLRWSIRNALKISITDTQCGLKGFNDLGKAIFLSTTINRYLFDVEFIYLSSKPKNHIRFQSVEVSLREGVIFRKMNPKILFQEGINFLKIMFK